MSVHPQTARATSSAKPHTSNGLGSTLFRVAWLAILLGFAMETLLLLFTAGFDIVGRNDVGSRVALPTSGRESGFSWPVWRTGSVYPWCATASSSVGLS